MLEIYEALRSLSLKASNLAGELTDEDAYIAKLHPLHDKIVYQSRRLDEIALELANFADEIMLEGT